MINKSILLLFKSMQTFKCQTYNLNKPVKLLQEGCLENQLNIKSQVVNMGSFAS